MHGEVSQKRLEFKKSTALLSRAGETLCGFLNCKGGTVIIGVNARGEVVGQHVSDGTQQEIAMLVSKIEPPAAIEFERINFENSKDVIVLTALPRKSDIPYVYEGKPYQKSWY